MIKLMQTKNEYLLTIPSNQKDRAKSIDSHKWDMSRKVWVYPKNKDIYAALMHEFENDLFGKAKSKQESSDVLKEFEKLSKKIENLAGAGNLSEDASDLHATIGSRDAEIKSLKAELKILGEINTDYESTIVKLKNEVDLYKKHNGSNPTVSEEIKSLAKFCTGNNKSFGVVIDKIKLDDYFPINIQEVIVHCLREELKIADPGMTLHEILKYAKEEGLLPDEAIDLAHSIRKQRNLFAHGQLNQNQKTIRSISVLIDSSLLWSYLNCD